MTDTNTDLAAAPTSHVITVNGTEVTLPVRFKTGHILTGNQARILDKAVRDQFRGSMATDALNREKTGKPQLTALELAEKYATYEHEISGAIRASSLEKLRFEAGLAALVEVIDEHNALVGEGRPGILASPKAVNLPTGKGSGEAKEALVRDKILVDPKYAERVQRHLDALLAKRGAGKTAGPKADTVTADAL